MALIDQEYYNSVYMGEPVDEADFLKLLRRAEDAVGALTRFQVTEENIDALPPIISTLYKKALAAQIEYLQEIGVNAAITGESGIANGFTVGKVHIGGRSGQAGASQDTLIAPGALALLEQTGLLARHVDTCDWGWP